MREHTTAINSYSISPTAVQIYRRSKDGEKRDKVRFFANRNGPRTKLAFAYRRVLAGYINDPGSSSPPRLLIPSIYHSIPAHSPLFSPPLDISSKMAAIAGSFRPLASRMLSQRLPLASSCRVSPVIGFPRGSARCFSQSPLCMTALPIVIPSRHHTYN